MGSGVIFVIIVALWAMLLVPALLRRHDEAVESRSVDRFSAAMRILSRRTPDVAGQRYVVMPRRPAWASSPVVTAKELSASSGSRGQRRRTAPARATAAMPRQPQRPVARSMSSVDASRARLAARRRRMLLLFVVVATALVLLAGSRGGVWYGAAACACLVVFGYVGHLRGEAQRARQRARRRHELAARASRRGRAAPAAPAARSTAPRQRAAAMEQEVSDVVLADTTEVVATDTWEPVPVTLPTYVTKPVAPQPAASESAPSWVDTGNEVYDQMLDLSAEPAYDEPAQRAVGD